MNKKKTTDKELREKLKAELKEELLQEISSTCSQDSQEVGARRMEIDESSYRKAVGEYMGT